MLGTIPPPAADVAHALVDAARTTLPRTAAAGAVEGTAPLQASAGSVPWLQIVLVAMAAASTVLGLYVGYQGYRGFRRNDSTPMKFLSLGLILLTAVTYGLSFGGSLAFQYDLVPGSLRPAWQVSVRAAQLAGLACIVYALYRRP